MDGILNVNKPSGMTSFSVVAKVKRLAHEKHVGHAGTLDPLATGVLPVCLGQATRVIEFLFDETKTYRAEIVLGVTTDTYDSSGKVVREADPSAITCEMVEAALGRFRGNIQQTPPMYSAIKLHGQPLYKLARSGIVVERKSRPCRIHKLEIIECALPLFTLEIVCGKGTYIRSLAYDLGEVLGCGANMRSLIRTRVGAFKIEDALTLPQLEEAFQGGYGEKYLYPPDSALSSFDAVVVKKELQCSLHHGAAVALELPSGPETQTLTAESRLRAYTLEGDFIGMIKFDPEALVWRPEKIFLKSCCQQTTDVEVKIDPAGGGNGQET